MIDGEKLENAERRLREISRVGDTPRVQFGIARVDRPAFENLLQHHMQGTFKTKYTIDPRQEGAINTMLLHFFLVGVLTGRTDSIT